VISHRCASALECGSLLVPADRDGSAKGGPGCHRGVRRSGLSPDRRYRSRRCSSRLRVELYGPWRPANGSMSVRQDRPQGPGPGHPQGPGRRVGHRAPGRVPPTGDRASSTRSTPPCWRRAGTTRSPATRPSVDRWVERRTVLDLIIKSGAVHGGSGGQEARSDVGVSRGLGAGAQEVQAARVGLAPGGAAPSTHASGPSTRGARAGEST
jgi:hypothetical protein